VTTGKLVIVAFKLLILENTKSNNALFGTQLLYCSSPSKEGAVWIKFPLILYNKSETG
jgi:hypothetical protein